MRVSLLSLLFAALLAGCAGLPPTPPPLSEAEIVSLARAGEPAGSIVRRLQESGTVLHLSGSDFVRLHGAGVPQEVLDALQRAQMEEVRRREAMAHMQFWPQPWPGFASPWHCPWPPSVLRPYGWRRWNGC